MDDLVERGVALNVELIVYALVATASPLGLGVTLAVVASGRTKSLLFALGFVLGQGVACALVAFVDVSLVVGRRQDHGRLRGALELALGAVLLMLAARVRRGTAKSAEAQARRSRAIEDRLGRVRKTTALLAGLALGIGGPKRLILTGLAGTSIALSGVDDTQTLVLVVAYTAVATLLVWLPVLAFAVAGDRVVGTLHAAQVALVRHERLLTFSSLGLIGAFAVVDGVAKLR